MQKNDKKNEKTVPPAECAVPAGGKEGSKPSGVCETFCTTLHAIFLHAKNHAIKVMQGVYARVTLAFSTPRWGAADDGKRASSAIEVAGQSPWLPRGRLGGGSLKRG